MGMKKFRWNEEEETLDSLFEGRLKILQKKNGYRFSIDALLLAHFAATAPQDRIIDLGTGCGIISLILLARRKAESVTAVEIQPSLAGLARRNAALNRFSRRMHVREGDLKEGLSRQGVFDRVICNPPYRKIGTGRMNPGMEKARARHELEATLRDVLCAAERLLKERGTFTLIYPASRSAELMQEMGRFRLEPKRLQFVHSRLEEEARLVLAEGLKGGRVQARILPPFILYDASGRYTPQAEALFH